MKFLFLLLISTPVFACKMTPEGWRNSAEAAAIKVVAAKTGDKGLKAIRKDGQWFVRTTKLNCVEYRISIDNGNGDCNVTGTIVSEKPCR